MGIGIIKEKLFRVAGYMLEASPGDLELRDGIFELLEHAPGYTVDEIRAATGAPLHVSPTLRPIPL